MNTVVYSILGAVLAGVISTFVYELIRVSREHWILYHRPIQYRYTSPDQLQYSNMATNFQLRFYLRNRTKVSLPILIFPSANGVKYQQKPIQWEGRSQKYGLQDITLSPEEWGNFYLDGTVINNKKPTTVSIDLEVEVPNLKNRVQMETCSTVLKYA